MALLHGWDPIEYMRLTDLERIVADVVLRRAAEMRAEQRREELSALAHNIGSHVGSTVAQLFSRAH